MGLEVATYITDLVSTNPVSSDGVGQGDDHLRLIKSVLLNTFPNFGDKFSDVTQVATGVTVASTNNTALFYIPTATGATNTHTFSMPALSSITAGFYIDIRNAPNNDYAIVVPTGGASIEGAASLTVLPNYWARVFYDGTTWRAMQTPIGADGGQMNRIAHTLNTGTLNATSLSVAGVAVFLSTMNVTSIATFNNNVTIVGAAVLSATLSVSGAVTMLGTLSVSGAAHFTTTLSVGGAATLGGTLTVSGAARIGGALTVAGAAHMQSTVSILGAATLASTLSVSGAAHVTGALSLGGAATFSSTLTVSGAAVLLAGLTVGGNLTVSAAARIGGTLTVSGATHLQSTVSILGAATLASTLSVSGAAHITGALSVGGAATLASTLSVSGAAHITGALSLGGAATMSGTLTVSGAATFHGGVSVSATVHAPVFMGNNACTSWVRFSATGTVTINGQFNVASLTDTAVGNFTVNLTTTLSSSAYAVFTDAKAVDSNATQTINVAAYALTLLGYSIRANNDAGTGVDGQLMFAGSFGGR